MNTADLNENIVSIRNGTFVPNTTQPHYSKLILIVDSSRYSAQLTARLLQSWGYSTEIAHSPSAALKVLLSGEVLPDMIFVEMLYHHENVFRFPKEVHASDIWKNLPIVAHSVPTNRQNIVRAIQSGYCDYIIRPTEPDILKEKIEKVLSRSLRVDSSTFSVPISATGEASFEMRLNAISEFGIEGWSSEKLEPNKVIKLKSEFLRRFELEDCYVRVVGCEETSARSFRYKVALTFVGLKPHNATLIRQFLIAESRKMPTAA